MDSISIADSRLGTSICCSTTESDSYPVENLIDNNATHGFMADYYIRPPVTVTLHFPVPLHLVSLEWDCRVENQLALSHEVWSSSSKLNNCGINCKLVKSGTADPPAVFQKIGRGDAKNGKIKFSNKVFSSEGYRLACPSDRSVITAACSVAIKILWCRNSAIPCINNLNVLVRKSGESAEYRLLVQKSKEIENVSRSALSSITFFGVEDESVVNDKTSDDVINTQDIGDKFEVPPDYLDEITQEMMTIPMTLPSGKTVDQLTVEKCRKSQELWGGPARDPFTGQIFTKTVRPMFDSALKSRIDRFLLENGSKVELRHVGRTVGSAKEISQFLGNKSRGIKRCYGGEIKEVSKSKVSLNSDCSPAAASSPETRVTSSTKTVFDRVLPNAIRQLPPIVKAPYYKTKNNKILEKR